MSGAEADPELAELIRRAIASDRADIQVSMPGIVVSYDPDTETATIQPATRRARYNADDEIEAEEIPPIQNVPVIWPSCAAFSMSGVLAAGDGVDLVFSTFSHAGYRNTGAVSTPLDLRPQSLGYPKAYPGFKSKNKTGNDTDNSIGKPTTGPTNPSRLHFASSGIEVGKTALQAVAIAQKVAAELIAVKATLLTGSNSGGPVVFGTPYTGPADLGASNLKAEV